MIDNYTKYMYSKKELINNPAFKSVPISMYSMYTVIEPKDNSDIYKVKIQNYFKWYEDEPDRNKIDQERITLTEINFNHEPTLEEITEKHKDYLDNLEQTYIDKTGYTSGWIKGNINVILNNMNDKDLIDIYNLQKNTGEKIYPMTLAEIDKLSYIGEWGNPQDYGYKNFDELIDNSKGYLKAMDYNYQYSRYISTNKYYTNNGRENAFYIMRSRMINSIQKNYFRKTDKYFHVTVGRDEKLPPGHEGTQDYFVYSFSNIDDLTCPISRAYNYNKIVEQYTTEQLAEEMFYRNVSYGNKEIRKLLDSYYQNDIGEKQITKQNEKHKEIEL